MWRSPQEGAQRVIADCFAQRENLLCGPFAQNSTENEVFVLARVELRRVNVPK
jgi:hypothetical protein